MDGCGDLRRGEMMKAPVPFEGFREIGAGKIALASLSGQGQSRDGESR
jgi:hypothetical protein